MTAAIYCALRGDAGEARWLLEGVLRDDPENEDARAALAALVESTEAALTTAVRREWTR